MEEADIAPDGLRCMNCYGIEFGFLSVPTRSTHEVHWHLEQCSAVRERVIIQDSVPLVHSQTGLH